MLRDNCVLTMNQMWRCLPMGVLAALMLIASSGIAGDQLKEQAQEPLAIGPKRTIGVLSFEVKIGLSSMSGVSVSGGLNSNSASGSHSSGTIAIPNPTEFGEGLTEVMITSLATSSAFTVFETSPAIPESQSNPPMVPQYFMKAVVSAVSCRQRSGGINFGGLGAGQGQYENKVTLDVRLVDPLTNIVLESVQATGKKTSKASIFGFTKYAGGSSWNPGTKVLDLTYADFESSPLAEAARLATADAVKKLRDKVARRPWQAAVLKVTYEGGPEIYLNLPGDCGLKPGLQLELCRYGEDIVNPKTNLVIGRTRPTTLGDVQVFMTDSDTVICKPIGHLLDSFPADEQGLFVRLSRS